VLGVGGGPAAARHVDQNFSQIRNVISTK
jgi:hypothetical protein